MKWTFKHTLYASYTGYITQAIVATLPPLLFTTYRSAYGISFDKIAALISLLFFTQIITDLVAIRLVDRIGYRASAVGAHALAAAGLVLMAVLPNGMENAYAGLIVASLLNAAGSGLIEVIISPIVEYLPGEEKAQGMSMLHSFFCWGQVGVVLLSTAFLAFAKGEVRTFLPALWALLPLGNLFLFLKVPIREPNAEEGGQPLRALLSSGTFWLCILMMICAGSAEQSMSQWASLFAEEGLGVNKTVGDLFGPCAFAVLMGSGRVFQARHGLKKHGIPRSLARSAALCLACYLVTVFAPYAWLSLIACAVCGLSVAVMWPGTFSLSAEKFPAGGTTMFAILALAGDVGCTVGPSAVGLISDRVMLNPPQGLQTVFSAATVEQAGIKTGLLIAAVFPLLMCVLSFAVSRRHGGSVPVVK